MSEVVLDCVSKLYGRDLAVDRVSLTIGEGEFVTLLGASGSGKTTCLRMIAGFVVPNSGRVLIGGADFTRVPPNKRNTAMVFQQYALFPHLTVFANVAFGLQVRGTPRAEIGPRVDAILKLVQMEHLAGRFPAELSGGQKQRVALARAVVLEPQILLLDEPLGALDLKLREELQLEIKRVQAALGVTTLFVTHDQGEALSLSDRVAVMHRGRIVQIDSPTKLYREPVNGVVARFIGRMTLLPVRLTAVNGAHCQVADAFGGTYSTASWPDGVHEGAELLLGVRPESYRLELAGVNRCTVRIERSLYQGATWLVHCRDRNGQAHIAELPLGAAQPKDGDQISLSWHPQDCRAIWPE